MFKKWWVILIQGILLVVLGIYIFNNPGELLAGISLWIGILALITGVIGIIGWFIGGKENRETGMLLWSIITTLLGILVLTNLLTAMKIITVIFGIWVLMTGFSILKFGWSLKKESMFGWILILVGVLSLFAGISMIFNIGSGAEGIAVILGIQVILTGVSLILLSIFKKTMVSRVKNKLE